MRRDNRRFVTGAVSTLVVLTVVLIAASGSLGSVTDASTGSQSALGDRTGTLQVRAEGMDDARPLPQLRMAPQRRTVSDAPAGNTGFIAPSLDLPHLTGATLPDGAVVQAMPAEFDWRDQDGTSYVTPVKDQGDCGSCYAFAAIGDFESKLLIGGAGAYDLSENHAKACNWRAVNGFEDPPGVPWGSCSGGNAYMMTSLFSQAGTVLEAWDPYIDEDVPCKQGSPYSKSLLGWRIISDRWVPETTVLKYYIYNYGPVYSAMYVDSSKGFNDGYDGSFTFDYSTFGDGVDHAVLIVGWSDNLPPVPGSSIPAEGWIVKNSWGTGWGDEGYFYMTYGSGNIGTYSSFVYDWQDYDPYGDLWYYDDDGFVWSVGCEGQRVMWALARFTAPEDTNVSRVELWTTDATTGIDIYIYGAFDGNEPTNLLTTSLDHAFSEPGYHSVPLSAPLPVDSGEDVVVVARIANGSYGYPAVIDWNGPIESERTYLSCTGSAGSWADIGPGVGELPPADVAIRVRTSADWDLSEEVFLPLLTRD